LETAPILTDRLAMRLPRVADGRLVYDGYATDHEAIRWMGFRPHTGPEVADNVVGSWCQSWEGGSGMLTFIVEDRTTAEFLGVVSLSLDAHGLILGYIFCRHAWGKGIATEATRPIVDLAFERFDAWRVWATCAPQNPASRRVLEKIGMRHEGVLRRWIVSPLVSPEPRDSDCLSITRDDWASR
jgi:RimJ/RimL family protein N-acetyltransferase